MAVNFPFAQPIVPANAKKWRDDLHFDGTFDNHWAEINTGGGAVDTIADVDGASYGRVRLRVAALASTSAFRSNSGIVPPYPFFLLWQCNLIPSALSVPADRYYVQMGFTDNGAVAGLPANGYGFRYSDNINSGFWECFSVAGGVPTLLNSVQAANITKNTFRMYSVSATGPIVFLVNDRLVGAISTNIPFGVTMFSQISASKTIGATQRDFFVDYAGLYYVRGDT